MALVRKNGYIVNALRKGYRLIYFVRSKFLPLKMPLHNNEDYEPFFIVGSGRSGNTLLRRILNNHDDIFIPPETYVLGLSIRQYILLPFLGWRKMVEKIFFNFSSHPEFHTFSLNNFNDLVIKMRGQDVNDRSLAFLLSSFYDEYGKQHGISASRWGDKTPLNTFSMHEIFGVFPKSKFIHILRDPYDVVSSYVEAGKYQNVTDAAFRWVGAVSHAKEFGKNEPNSYCEITYEDLVQHPEETVRSICKFLDVEFDFQMLEVGNDVNKLGDVNVLNHHHNVKNPISLDSIGKASNKLTDPEVKMINKVLCLAEDESIRKYAKAI